MKWVVLVLAIASCSHGGSPAATARAPSSAAEIVAAMQATYAKARTYSDHGVARNGSTMRSFETTFVRSSRFRFDLRDENEPRRGFVMWADPTHTYTRWYGPPHTSDDGPGLAVAVAITAAPSLGAVPTLVRLLDPKALPAAAALGRAQLTGTEPIDDRSCWVVSGTQADSEVTLWIDRETYALRRAKIDSDDLSFTPTLDAAIDVAHVPPPDFSDDYEEGSPEQLAVRGLVGKPAPAFDAALADGSGRATLGGLAGKVVIVDFWASWCGPCRRTMPRLVKWHRELADRGLAIVGLSSEDRDDIAKTVADQHLTYTIARDEDAKIARTYKVTALPMLVVVDRAGIVRYATLGAGNLDAVEAVISSLL